MNHESKLSASLYVYGITFNNDIQNWNENGWLWEFVLVKFRNCMNNELNMFYSGNIHVLYLRIAWTNELHIVWFWGIAGARFEIFESCEFWDFQILIFSDFSVLLELYLLLWVAMSYYSDSYLEKGDDTQTRQQPATLK